MRSLLMEEQTSIMKTASLFLPKPFIENEGIAVKVDADIVRMDSKKKVSISWSGGKDSAFALYKIMRSGNYQVVSLHTVIGKNTARVGMHGVREELIELQAQAIGLPLEKIYLDAAEDHIAYETCMKDYYKRSAQNIDAIVFGDIYLEDLKTYREKLLDQSGIKGLFPLWQTDPPELIHDFLNSGFKTAVCSCNEELYQMNLAGRVINKDIVEQLPASVDPCGERGEFHTFVFDGPIFKNQIMFTKGELVSKTYRFKKLDEAGLVKEQNSVFWFQDFLPLIAS